VLVRAQASRHRLALIGRQVSFTSPRDRHVPMVRRTPPASMNAATVFPSYSRSRSVRSCASEPSRNGFFLPFLHTITAWSGAGFAFFAVVFGLAAFLATVFVAAVFFGGPTDFLAAAFFLAGALFLVGIFTFASASCFVSAVLSGCSRCGSHEMRKVPTSRSILCRLVNAEGRSAVQLGDPQPYWPRSAAPHSRMVFGIHVGDREMAERLSWDAGGLHLRNRLSELAAMEIVAYLHDPAPTNALIKIEKCEGERRADRICDRAT
jgi:hypothetical protein